MKIRSDDPQKLTDFKCLAFDCYGTLVDWESGIYDELQPLRSRLPASHPFKKDRNGLIAAFDAEERAVLRANPKQKYSTVLSDALTNLSRTLSIPPHPPTSDELVSLASSIGKWPAFPDTVRGLQQLQRHYKLVVLTNCDVASFHATLAGPLKDIKFDAVYIAEEIGSYKPNLANFRYLIEKAKEGFEMEGGEVLMTAHGLRSDHVPALEMGISSAWIARGEGAGLLGEVAEKGRGGGEEAAGGGGGVNPTLEEVKGEVGFTWVFDTMGDMAEAAEKEFDWEHRQMGSS